MVSGEKIKIPIYHFPKGRTLRKRSGRFKQFSAKIRNNASNWWAKRIAKIGCGMYILC